jgi:hypothetical protein
MHGSKTIPQFCQSEQISKSFFYEMQREGWAPDVEWLGRLRRITDAAHRRWQRQRERAAELQIPGALPAHEIAALDEEEAAALRDIPLGEVPATQSLSEEPP